MKSKGNIVFLGMMGSGKSSIGKLVSKKLELNFFDIDQKIEEKFSLSLLAISEPIELFPDPIIPKNTRFSFDFISFFIEKTQICLNLKLTKVICNLIKIQVQVKLISKL